MHLALHFPCVYPLRRVTSANLFLSESSSRTAFNGDRRIRLQEIASSFSMERSKKGIVCCKKPSDDEQTSKPSKANKEEIISLFRRIQSSISKGESQGVEEEKKKKHRDESSENEPLSKAILDVLEKQRQKTQGDTSVKEPPNKQGKLARPPSSSASGPRGKLPVPKSDIALEEKTEKEEKAPLIETMKLAELKEVAKNRGIKGYSRLKKSELLKLIRLY